MKKRIDIVKENNENDQDSFLESYYMENENFTLERDECHKCEAFQI